MPWPLCPREKDVVPIVQGGPQGQSGWVEKILSPPGFDPWTIQSIVSCTDCVILAMCL
jgi:hypothetical protein